MRLELIWWVAFTSRPREEIPRRKVDSAKEMGVGIGHEAWVTLVFGLWELKNRVVIDGLVSATQH